MEAAEKDEKGDKESPLLQIDPKWCVRRGTSLASLTAELSLQDALRTFFQPIKTNDPRVDFYTMYKREATEHDADYVKKYDEDLNTTLIFVCPPLPTLVNHLTRARRRVFSLPSAPHSLLTFVRTSSPIRTPNLRLFSAQSSSPSTNPQS